MRAPVQVHAQHVEETEGEAAVHRLPAEVERVAQVRTRRGVRQNPAEFRVRPRDFDKFLKFWKTFKFGLRRAGRADDLAEFVREQALHVLNCFDDFPSKHNSLLENIAERPLVLALRVERADLNRWLARERDLDFLPELDRLGVRAPSHVSELDLGRNSICSPENNPLSRGLELCRVLAYQDR